MGGSFAWGFRRVQNKSKNSMGRHHTSTVPVLLHTLVKMYGQQNPFICETKAVSKTCPLELNQMAL